MSLAALRAIAEQGHFKVVLMNADVTVVSNPAEEVQRDCIVAWANSRLGFQDVAVSVAEKAYHKALEELGEDHEITLVALNDFARFSHRAGNHQVGLDAGRDVFARRTRVLGPHHPKTLTSQANILSYQYESTGEADIAELDALMKVWAAVDPERKDAAHLSAALLRANVMQSLASRARAEVVAWYLETLGEEHPDTLRASTQTSEI